MNSPVFREIEKINTKNVKVFWKLSFFGQGSMIYICNGGHWSQASQLSVWFDRPQPYRNVVHNSPELYRQRCSACLFRAEGVLKYYDLALRWRHSTPMTSHHELHAACKCKSASWPLPQLQCVTCVITGVIYTYVVQSPVLAIQYFTLYNICTKRTQWCNSIKCTQKIWHTVCGNNKYHYYRYSSLFSV